MSGSAIAGATSNVSVVELAEELSQVRTVPLEQEPGYTCVYPLTNLNLHQRTVLGVFVLGGSPCVPASRAGDHVAVCQS